MSKQITTMKSAQRAMPLCLVGTSCDDASSLAELRHLVRCEIDLIEEGEDAANDYSRQDLAAIRRYYARLDAARNRQEAENAEEA